LIAILNIKEANYPKEDALKDSHKEDEIIDVE